MILLAQAFWCEEPLVSDIHRELLPGDGVCAGELLDVFAGLGVELVELLGDVGAHVAVALLDCLGNFHRLFWGNSWEYINFRHDSDFSFTTNLFLSL